ncbi:MAG: hypothetical protein P4M10_08470 [Verrucomicrobiae bacterium]|nr:hypothetical protein [Verrucomicrobiae bacterium]
MKMAFVAMCLILSGIASYFGQPFVGDNSEAITIITTVITVFAGFLVAIMAILGDPALLPKGSWRAAEIGRGKVEGLIIRHTWIFYIYLISIGLLFSGVLVHKIPNAVVSGRIKIIIEYSYLFFGVFSFLLTMALPRVLGQIQLARSESEIEARRAAAGIRPPS